MILTPDTSGSVGAAEAVLTVGPRSVRASRLWLLGLARSAPVFRMCCCKDHVTQDRRAVKDLGPESLEQC
jgi:hypothetical protein